MENELIIEVYDEGEAPDIWAALPIDSEEIVKGATGLNRYINNPAYRPKTVVYRRTQNGKEHIAFGTVYEKEDKNVIKNKLHVQHKVESDKEAKGKSVKLHFKDEHGEKHETKHAKITHQDDKHLHVKLTKDIRHPEGHKKAGQIAHEKGKTIKVPKIVTKEWLHNAGDTRVEHHEKQN